LVGGVRGRKGFGTQGGLGEEAGARRGKNLEGGRGGETQGSPAEKRPGATFGGKGVKKRKEGNKS